MENASWNDIIAAERKNLAPIMEEEDKGQVKGLSSISFLISLVSILYENAKLLRRDQSIDLSADQHIIRIKNMSRTNIFQSNLKMQLKNRFSYDLCESEITTFSMYVSFKKHDKIFGRCPKKSRDSHLDIKIGSLTG